MGSMHARLRIGPASAEDLPACLAISNASAASGAANFATEPERLADWVAAWRAHETTHPWLVVRTDREILGFAKAAPHRTRGAYAWSADLSVYLDPAARGAGIGAALYAELLPRLRRQGFATLIAGITSGHTASERLHAGFGFVRCGTFHRIGWKNGHWHDVGYWELALAQATPPAPLRSVAEGERLRGIRSVEMRATDLADPAIAGLIGALNAELGAAYPEPGATHFGLAPEEIAQGAGVLLLALADGEPAACGALRTIDGKTAEIKRMFVVPERRRAGLSLGILRRLEAWARALGRRRVLLETGTRQAAALGLYERAGYRRIPPFGEYVRSAATSVCLARDLA
jgi:phosphinothricin acetyltransferase